ncbi:MAG: hypothetical protein ACE5G3_02175 [Gammaproteobacteria bacterium]
MSAELINVRAGIAIVLLGLFLNVAMGISFGVNEDAYKDYVAEGIAAHPDVHDAKSQDKIWRYAQRTHFHAGGIAAFCLGLIILSMFSGLEARWQKISAVLIGLGSFYPLAWLSMFFLAPSIGRGAAHDHVLTTAFTFVGVGGILLGSAVLLGNLYLGLFGRSA